MSNNTIICILDKDYQVSCPPEERTALLESARVLDQRMKNIKNSGNILGVERIAVMAALNLTYELMKIENDGQLGVETEQRLKAVDNKLDAALHELENTPLF